MDSNQPKLSTKSSGVLLDTTMRYLWEKNLKSADNASFDKSDISTYGSALASSGDHIFNFNFNFIAFLFLPSSFAAACWMNPPARFIKASRMSNWLEYISS